jgi:hypothetical protein
VLVVENSATVRCAKTQEAQIPQFAAATQQCLDVVRLTKRVESEAGAVLGKALEVELDGALATTVQGVLDEE